MPLLTHPPLDCPKCRTRTMYRVSERRGLGQLWACLLYSYRCRQCDTIYWCLSSNLVGWHLRRLTAVLATLFFLIFIAAGAWLVTTVFLP
jgi:hypothetical protein